MSARDFLFDKERIRNIAMDLNILNSKFSQFKRSKRNFNFLLSQLTSYKLKRNL